MATLSSTDKKNLNAQQQADVLKAKQDWEAANAIGDTAAMEKAHAAAEAVRASAASGAYSGGAAGNAYVSQSNGGNNPYMSSSPSNGNATLSASDNAYLNAQQQAQIAALKAEWAKANAANNQAAMDAAHAAAEAIRQTAGYSGGAGGTDYNRLGANAGGMTADDMAKWLADYQATNYRAGAGWTNGYSTAMNTRTKANQIRQQMLANEQAQANADAATKDYLHQQNLALAQLLYQYTGHTDKTTWYNEELRRWETLNPDVGYGTDINHTYDNIYNSMKNYMGYTDEDIQRFANDTGHYYNFVDPRLNRLAIDESRGYTGKYSQFANGPYLQLLGGGTHDGSVNPSVYQDVFGDGFGNEAPLANFTPIRDENGNVLNAELPPLKNNNAMTDYTNQFTSYVANGVIQPGLLAARNPGASGDAYGAYSRKTGGSVDASDPRYTGGIDRDVAASTPEDPNNLTGQLAYWEIFQNSPLGQAQGANGSGLSGSGAYGSYLEQMYAAALQAQLEQLKDSYNQNISQLDASKGEVDDTYTEQKRQTTGTNAQQAANWRELANAYGLNSGAIGQAALAQNNQLQSNLNTLESAQAAAQAEIERQRTLLGQQYQSQINQALAENNYQLAQALYQEAVRQDDALRQQQQFNANLALQYAQLAQQQSQFDAELALSAAKAMGSSGSSGGSGGSVSASAGSDAGYIPVEGVDESEKYYQLYRDAYNQPNPQNYISSNYKKYGLTNSSGLSGQYDDWAKQELNYAALSDRIYNTPSLSNEEQFTMMRDAWQKGYIGDDQYNRFLNYTNVDLNRINGV